MDYVPEIGQSGFGQPWQRYDGGELLSAALMAISAELERVMWNKHQEEYHSPFFNNGPVGNYKNDTFEVQAYSWDDEVEQPFNFKWQDVEISWYKHCRRGLSVNQELKADRIAQMLSECLESIRAEDVI